MLKMCPIPFSIYEGVHLKFMQTYLAWLSIKLHDMDLRSLKINKGYDMFQCSTAHYDNTISVMSKRKNFKY